MDIIPAIDIIDGKCVRLTKGDYRQQKVYNEDPVRVALNFEKKGIKKLHLVDLEGAKGEGIKNLQVLNEIASVTSLEIDFGGGIKSAKQLELALKNGASQVTAGSMAASNPALVVDWIEEFGADKLILGADVKDERVMVSGWQKESKFKIWELLEFYENHGLCKIICTDISLDGMLTGPSFNLYREIKEQFPSYHLIASGGVSSLSDLIDLKEMHLHGAIIGKAYYEGHISLEEMITV